MISEKQKELLKSNWGDKTDSLECKAIVRLFCDKSKWECYIISMNPDDEDEIMCLTKPFDDDYAFVEPWSLQEISLLYNLEGEFVRSDKEFVPRYVKYLIKKMNKQYDS